MSCTYNFFNAFASFWILLLWSLPGHHHHHFMSKSWCFIFENSSENDVKSTSKRSRIHPPRARDILYIGLQAFDMKVDENHVFFIFFHFDEKSCWWWCFFISPQLPRPLPLHPPRARDILYMFSNMALSRLLACAKLCISSPFLIQAFWATVSRLN